MWQGLFPLQAFEIFTHSLNVAPFIPYLSFHRQCASTERGELCRYCKLAKKLSIDQCGKICIDCKLSRTVARSIPYASFQRRCATTQYGNIILNCKLSRTLRIDQCGKICFECKLARTSRIVRIVERLIFYVSFHRRCASTKCDKPDLFELQACNNFAYRGNAARFFFVT